VAGEDPILEFLWELLEREVGGDRARAAKGQQVALRFEAVPDLPRFDATIRQRSGAVGDGAIVVDRDDASEAFASGAGANGMVEAEECGRGFAVVEVAVGAVKAGGEGAGLAEGAGRIDLEDGQLAFAVVVGLLARFNEAGSLGLLDFQAVLDDGDARWRPAESGVARCLIEADVFR